MATQDHPEAGRRWPPDEPDEQDGTEGRVAAALAVFATFRDELDALLCEVRRGETERAKKLMPVVSELARAVNRIAEEQAKLDARHGRGEGAGDAAAALDLAAARAEVSRRLAELRDSGG